MSLERKNKPAWQLMVMLCFCLLTSDLWQHCVCHCVCVDELNTPTYSTVIYRPVFPSDLVTMQSSGPSPCCTLNRNAACIARAANRDLSCCSSRPAQPHASAFSSFRSHSFELRMNYCIAEHNAVEIWLCTDYRLMWLMSPPYGSECNVMSCS